MLSRGTGLTALFALALMSLSGCGGSSGEKKQQPSSGLPPVPKVGKQADTRVEVVVGDRKRGQIIRLACDGKRANAEGGQLDQDQTLKACRWIERQQELLNQDSPRCTKNERRIMRLTLQGEIRNNAVRRTFAAGPCKQAREDFQKAADLLQILTPVSDARGTSRKYYDKLGPKPTPEQARQAPEMPSAPGQKPRPLPKPKLYDPRPNKRYLYPCPPGEEVPYPCVKAGKVEPKKVR